MSLTQKLLTMGTAALIGLGVVYCKDDYEIKRIPKEVAEEVERDKPGQELKGEAGIKKYDEGGNEQATTESGKPPEKVEEVRREERGTTNRRTERRIPEANARSAGSREERNGVQNFWTDRFVDNANGTITDTDTSLIWEKKPNKEFFGWEKAKDYCENLTKAGYDDWKLPSYEQIKTLIVHWSQSTSCTRLYGSPKSGIDNIFDVGQLNPGDKFWTSTSIGWGKATIHFCLYNQEPEEERENLGNRVTCVRAAR